MFSPRNQIIELVEQGAIPTEKIGDALIVAKVAPDGKAWRTIIDHLLLWLGGLALAFAVMFFVAYNWNDIGRFAKFAMVELFIVLAIIAYWKLGEQKVSGKVSLLIATVLLGVLLALYHQIYQTGADPWQLFFNWALLMLPWALIGRFPTIWIVWIVLINLSIVLYHQTFRSVFWFMFGSDAGMLWLLFFFNTLALIAWEFLAQTWRWLSQRWAIQLLGAGSGVPMTWLALHAIFEYENVNIFPGLVWAIWLGALYFVYRKIKPDLFMLAGGCLSGIVVLVTFMARLMDDFDEGLFFILALLVIGLGTGASVWLRNVHREWES
ncbi:MAG: DUF2157 domain-containing protein [Planctomycetes bacterium]|nr:DUF2157 domain-containing protein [Planctomycetota bacterium]